MHAVRRSLGSDTTFVWGPPGTGKTTTVARIVEAHYRAGRSVLLVSNTNIAVNTALERVAERLKGEADFHLGLVIRQGPVAKEELRQRFGKQVILEEIVARLGEQLRLQKEGFLRKSASIETEERSLEAALRDLIRLDHAQRALAARGEARNAVQANVAAREREASEYRVRVLQLRAKLDRARMMGAVRRFFSRLDPERLQRDAAATERQARAAADAARALAAPRGGGFAPPEGKPNNVVGAISPYASQARLIQSLLDDRLGQERAAGIAATVHRFQGNEKRAVLLDLTDSLGVRLGRLLRATRREEDGARLLNVAASRANDHVVLVGTRSSMAWASPVKAPSTASVTAEAAWPALFVPISAPARASSTMWPR